MCGLWGSFQNSDDVRSHGQSPQVDTVFFYNSVRHHGCDVSVKEIQNAIIDSLKAGPQFVNLVQEQVCFRASQFVPLIVTKFANTCQMIWQALSNLKAIRTPLLPASKYFAS